MKDYSNITRQEALQLSTGDGCTLQLSNAHYPANLNGINSPPGLLWVRGEPLISPYAIAIVGSRKGDTESCNVARILARQLAMHGVCVVSGLAAGVDAAAHRGALDAKGKTVAVIGSGVNHTYPRLNAGLERDIIAAGGTILSQFTPETPPYPANFIQRNRTIAALTLGVVVVQAAERSGSLATARFALEEGREVFVTPGPAFDLTYAGSHRLIREGASLITAVDQIFEALPMLDSHVKKHSPSFAENSGDDLTAQQKAICKVLLQNPLQMQQLRQLFPALTEIESIVLNLELDGKLIREPGGLIRAL